MRIDLQHEVQMKTAELEASGDPLAMAMESFRTMLMSLLATGELLDSEQLEACLTQIYRPIHGDRTKEVVAERMEWAQQYGWLPW